MSDPKYRAKEPGALPEGAEPNVGGVSLPFGRLIVPDPGYATGHPSSEPVLWISAKPVSAVGTLWERLAATFPSTGLWPLVLESLNRQDDRPWLDGELCPDATDESHDVTSVLADWWSALMPVDEEDDDALEALAPFGREFPGIADASEATRDAMASVRAAQRLQGRLGLVAVTRPADALAVLGWLGPTNHFSDMGLLSTVLRSWEDRFGAHVVGLGFDTMTLGVERPPRDPESALRVAAEHFAACPDNVYQGAGSVAQYASQIAGQNEWGFWWD
ncbi:MAG TPA: DUF4253 domain-containing protein [Polyangiaceae bacterium]